MFVKVIYLSVFYFLCCVTGIYTYMSDDRVAEDRYMDLNEEEDAILKGIRKEHYRGVDEEGDDKKKIHALRWEVYVKYK